MAERDAMMAAAKLEHEIAAGDFRSQLGKAQVRHVTKMWVDDRRASCSPKSMKSYENTAKKVEKFFGKDKPAAKITVQDALRLKSHMLRNYKVSTASRELSCISSMFTLAVKAEILHRNVFDAIDLPTNNVQVQYEHVPMDVFHRILSLESDVVWRAYFATLRMAGMRRNEPLRMGWQHINFERMRLIVPGNEDGRVTTKKRQRMVPLVAELLPYLLALQAESPEGSMKPFEQVSDSMVNARLHRITALAGCEMTLTPQALRVARENEWLQKHPFQEVAKWMGHSPRVQLRYYHDISSPSSQATMDAAIGTNTGTKQPEKKVSVSSDSHN